MKAKHIALSAAFLVIGAGAAGAQSTSTQPGETQPAPPAATSPIKPGAPSAASTELFAQRQMPGQWLATDYMSMNVYGPNNERIGDVNNILLDQNGKIVAILVGLGGFLGIGEKIVAVPYSSVKVSGPGSPLVVNQSKADIENAPSFVTARTSSQSSEK